MADISFAHILGRLQKFRKWVERVVVTGGEPTMQAHLPEALSIIKEQGFLIKLDTNGSRPAVIRSLVEAGLVDYVAMDVKGPLDSYDRWCGTKVNSDHIRESIDLLLQGTVDYEFRMTFVPFLHKEHDVYQAAEELKTARRFFIQEFVPRDTLDPAYISIRPFSPERMKSIRNNARTIIDHAPIRHHLY
jgi:pyruvate formate lyase activating enzyme